MRIMIIESTTPVDEVVGVETLMLARNQLKVIDDGYQELGLETPEWIAGKQLEVAKEITSRVEAELRRQLKMAKARRAAEAPKEEKIEKLDVTIVDLEKRLATL